MHDIKVKAEAGIPPILLPLKALPNNLVGAVLGVAGLGLVLRESGLSGPWPAMVAGILISLAAVMLLILLMLYGCKAVFFPEKALEDFRHPVLFSFYGQTPIAIFLFCEATGSGNAALAYALFWTGAILTAVHASASLRRWVVLPPTPGTIAPPALIPALSIIYLGLLASRFGLGWLSHTAFLVGGCASAFLMSMLTIKLISMLRVSAPAAVPYGLLMAPPALLFLARINLIGHRLDAFSTALFYAGLAYSALLLPVFMHIWRAPYSTAFWSFGMPFAAMILAIHEYAELSGTAAMGGLALIATAVLAATVLRCLLGMASGAKTAVLR
jgi:tellurite resistance protein